MYNLEDFNSILERYTIGPFSSYTKHSKSIGFVAHMLYTYSYIYYDTCSLGEKYVPLCGEKLNIGKELLIQNGDFNMKASYTEEIQMYNE